MRARPRLAWILSALLLAAAIAMALLGISASAYYFPAACLLLQAALVWRGSAWKVFERVMMVNQLTGLLLILVLWLGGGLGDIKLDVAGVMMIVNLLSGGPLMSLLALPIFAALRFGQDLPAWFQAQAALRNGHAS